VEFEDYSNAPQFSEFIQAFDRALSDLNIEYKQKRASERLGFPRLFPMQPGWADRQQKNDVLKKGKRDAQYKWRYIEYEWSSTLRSEVMHDVTCTN